MNLAFKKYMSLCCSVASQLCQLKQTNRDGGENALILNSSLCQTILYSDFSHNSFLIKNMIIIL